MKKIFLLLSLSVVLSFASTQAFAQKYQPRDRWPYFNPDFVEGNVKTTRGPLLEGVKMNISVVNGALHYISKDDIIMEVNMTTVTAAQIGSDSFLKASGRMMKVLAEVEGGAVLEDVEVDVEELNKTNIGYGIASSTASTQNISVLLDNAGFNSEIVNKSFYDVTIAKENGRYLPVKNVKYIWAKGMIIRASKSEIQSSGRVDKDDFNSFVKANKIKWNDVESLTKVAEYLSSQN